LKYFLDKIGLKLTNLFHSTVNPAKAPQTRSNKEKKGPRYSDLRFNTPNNLILPKMRFDGWYDHLITDLKLKRINYLIDPTVLGSSGLTSDDRDQDKILFRQIIITSIDPEYHHRIIEIGDPVEILNKMREISQRSIGVNPTVLKTQLLSLKFNPGESVNSFCQRFDDIVGEI